MQGKGFAKSFQAGDSNHTYNTGEKTCNIEGMEHRFEKSGGDPLKSHANINVYLRTSSRFEKSGNAEEYGNLECIKNKTICTSTRCV